MSSVVNVRDPVYVFVNINTYEFEVWNMMHANAIDVHY